ncbi:acetolactate synthase large subunit [Oceanicella actignis]|uniref:Acetolactate synthase-1/2/3 large subunit n=1 Tax=Oceanicella actignis TaxID=1189325 RepID=A0A1M7SU27_9RHOB|nr:acetolactate synthase large subunit [Oceanicella actignis]SES70911.1 acetolactate synthase-1/2/3 large subunit [Oceanicella actignis]SHN62025.1 acetolactate synthase-1/2/3 large subunit [Oceanicella actignis]
MTEQPMNGAESLVRALHGAGVEMCFANPGTSEMQFVDALGRTGLIRCVLGLAETVVAGAADGYARMTRKPAVTLLHLAPGFANAAANIHNARKARTPMVNLVGDHASRHLAYDAPLTADLDAAVAPFSDWVRRARSAAEIAHDGVAAVAAAAGRPGRIATLIAPGEAGWDPVPADFRPPAPVAPAGPRAVEDAAVARAAQMLDARAPAAIIAGGAVLEDPEAMALLRAAADKAGALFLAPGANRRIEHGAGRCAPRRIPYPVDQALALLRDVRRAVLIEAAPPVAFFAYPGKPSLILPPECEVLTLADFDQDGPAAARMLAERMGVRPAAPPRRRTPDAPAGGFISPDTLPAAIAAALPENAVVVDESITSGRKIFEGCAHAAPCSWLAITGGAIGIGPPLATGAALGAPDRPVVALQADGSAMYSIQALWTQAREGLNVTTVIFANRAYRILKGELMNVGANPGPQALNMLELDRPELGFVEIARGMGVPGRRVEDCAALTRAIADATREPGPFVIEAFMP